MSLRRIGTIVVLTTTMVVGCSAGDDSTANDSTVNDSTANDSTTTADESVADDSTADDSTTTETTIRSSEASTTDRDSTGPTTTVSASDVTESSAGSELASTTIAATAVDGGDEDPPGESRDDDFFRSQYLSVMEPLNCARGRLDAAEIEIMGDDLEFSDDEWPEMREPLNDAMATYGRSLVEAITRFDDLDWTPELDADVTALVSELNQAAGVALQGLAQAETLDQWQIGVEAWTALPHSAAAVMQAKLGFPADFDLDVPDEC